MVVTSSVGLHAVQYSLQVGALLLRILGLRWLTPFLNRFVNTGLKYPIGLFYPGRKCFASASIHLLLMAFPLVFLLEPTMVGYFDAQKRDCFLGH